MAFQIKDFTSIVASMINHMRGVQTELTDFSVGAVNRVMVEAPAIEIDELYQQMFNGLKEAIPVATYLSFDFAKLPAAPGSGIMRITITAGGSVLIPAGTVFSSPDAPLSYSSQADVTIAAAGTTVDLLVVASAAGVAGNIAGGISFSASPAIPRLVSAQTSGVIANGRDVETDDQRKQRFSLFISTLPRGTVDALKYGARTAALYDGSGIELERVKAVSVVEPYLDDPDQPIALVNVFVHNGVGSTSAELVAQADLVLRGYVDPATGAKVPGWKAAGVQLVTAAATEVPINVTATLVAGPGYVAADLADQAEATITEYMRSLDIGETYFRSEAIFRVKSLPGVVNITGMPGDNVVDPNEKIVPGTIAVTGT